MTGKSSETLVVFDCDGTLVDSQHNVVASMKDAFQTQGMPSPDEHSIRNCIGLNVDEAILQYLPDPSDAKLLGALVDAYKAAYFRRRQLPDHDEPLYRGTLETIRTLHRRGVKMAVATGKSMRGLNAVIDHHGLAGFFVSLQTPDYNPGKPHPQMLEKQCGTPVQNQHKPLWLGIPVTICCWLEMQDARRLVFPGVITTIRNFRKVAPII